MTFPIVVQADGGEPRVFTGRFTLGRRGDFEVADDYATPEHAVCYPYDGGWAVEDLGSTNGTWVGTVRVRMIPRPLARGDRLRIGNTMVTVVPV